MFNKMNPSAKEFVPAHLLKKRQEEAERLGELTEQMDKVNIKSETSDGSKENGEETRNKSTEENKEVQANSTTQNEQDETPNNNTNNINNSSSNNNNNNHYDGDGLQNLIDEDDERFLLNAGENICEFNGEQFIIPGDDDEYIPPNMAGYDFGNAEDNEDEDVCNAFEEFLDNLPGQ